MSQNIISNEFVNQNCCVFVGGLKATFTEEILQKHFSTFGEVESVTLKKNKKNKNINRGFCIVKFKCPNAVERMLGVKDHYIKKRLVTCRPYLKGEELKQSKSQKNNRKIYISGLPKETTNQDILEAFSKFGKVEAGYTLHDEEKGESKGFGFVTFRDEGVVKEVLKNNTSIQIHGKPIEIAKFLAHKEKSEIDENKSRNLLGELEEGIINEKNNKKLKINSKSFNFQPQIIESIGVLGPIIPKEQNKSSTNHILQHEQTPQKKLSFRFDFQIPQRKKGQVEKPIREISMKKKVSPSKCAPDHPSKVEKSLEDHQLLPTSKKYHSILSNNISKSWHDINITNIKLRIGTSIREGSIY